MIQVQHIPINDLRPAEYNPRKISKAELDKLKKNITEFGMVDPIIVNHDMTVIGGHQRLKACKALKMETMPCIVVNVSKEKEKALNLSLNRISGEWDEETLKQVIGELASLDEFDMDLTGFDSKEIDAMIASIGTGAKEEEEFDAESEAAKITEPRTKRGDVWLLGKHRVMCGDSTVITDVEKLMDGKKADLLHADPPYGMGKENEGIINDNLYKEKLDRFQMEWWTAVRAFINDNASAYIWGQAEDLWRLWYVGGLCASERLTLRNEIVWNKKHGQGMASEQHRMYPTASERCLFFMLGEQGFNNNADNYWEGWEPIRKYLEQERIKAGWDVPAMKRAVGHSDLNRDHWTSKSQWNFPSEEVYKKLQTASNGDAFKRDYDDLKRDYDDLKRDFYSTRAYFDNTHSNMIDVWEFDRVQGDERHQHATPKPVAIMERIIVSSLPLRALCVEPFLGSGSTLIAAEKTGRICYGMELKPKYCDVIVNRWEKYTGKTAVLENAMEAVHV